MNNFLSLVSTYENLNLELNRISQPLYNHVNEKYATLYDTHEEYELTSKTLITVINDLLDDDSDIKTVKTILKKQIDKDKQKKLAAEAYKQHLVETEIKPKEEKLKKVKSQIIQLFDSVSDNASVYKCNLGNLSKDDFSNLISYLKELKCFVISGKEQSLYFIHFFKQGKDERIQLSQELFDSISLSVKLKKNKIFDFRDFLNHTFTFKDESLNFKGFISPDNFNFNFILRHSEELNKLIIQKSVKSF